MTCFGEIQIEFYTVGLLEKTLLSVFNFNFLFFAFWAVSRAYGSFQARGQIGTSAAGLHHSHSNAGSELRLRPTPQLTATLDP